MRADERAPALYRVLHAIVPPIVNMLYRPWTEGVEHIPERGPAILASNHLSFLDSVFLPSACDRPIYFLGKSDYFVGWRRWFFESCGVMPVYREGGDAGEASLRRGQEILERGHLLGIYPEGTRSPDGRLYRGKTGPVRLALRTGAPIIPVGIKGTREIQPPDAKVPRPFKPAEVHFGRPIEVGRYVDRADDRLVPRQIIDEVMFEIRSLSGQEYVDEYASKKAEGIPAAETAKVVELDAAGGNGHGAEREAPVRRSSAEKATRKWRCGTRYFSGLSRSSYTVLPQFTLLLTRLASPLNPPPITMAAQYERVLESSSDAVRRPP